MLSAALLGLFDDKRAIINKLNEMKIPGIVYKLDEVEKYEVKGYQLHVLYDGQEEAQGFAHLKENEEKETLNAVEIIESINIPASVQRRATHIFRSLEDAEKMIHGRGMGQIHFHILGTMDAIADICAVCFMLEELNFAS